MTATARGARALVNDVQRFGLFSADTVVGRYTALVDRVLAGRLAAPSDPAGPGTEAALRLLESAAAVLGAGSAPTTGPETLALPPTPPGEAAELVLWVHNGTPSAVPAVAVRATGLVAASGRALPAEALSLAPDLLDLAAEGAQEIRLAVHVPPDQVPDHYLGLLLTSASPEQPMVLRLEVRR